MELQMVVFGSSASAEGEEALPPPPLSSLPAAASPSSTTTTTTTARPNSSSSSSSSAQSSSEDNNSNTNSNNARRRPRSLTAVTSTGFFSRAKLEWSRTMIYIGINLVVLAILWSLIFYSFYAIQSSFTNGFKLKEWGHESQLNFMEMTYIVKLAASNGDTAQLARYNETKATFNEAVQKIIENIPSRERKAFQEKTSESASGLEMMDARSVSLIERRELEGAHNVLNSNSYILYKTIYEEGVRDLNAFIDERAAREKTKLVALIIVSGILTVLSIPILLLVSALTIRIEIAHRRKLTEMKLAALRFTLLNKTARDNFMVFCQKEYSDENLSLWMEIDEYEDIIDDAAKKAKFFEIYNTYVDIKGKKPVNINSKLRKELEELKATLEVTQEFHASDYHKLKDAVEILMIDTYSRYEMSPIYKQLKSNDRVKIRISNKT